MNLDDPDIALIEQLVSNERYQQLMKIKPAFDLFEFLGRLMENASSRALAFLLSSDGEHGLGTSFLDALMWQVFLDSRDKPTRLSLGNVLSSRGSETSTTVEWGTEAGRRLDILVRVFDARRKMKAVVGIENKHGAGELPSQVEDYQRELDSRFAHISARMILFLTPEGKPAETAISDSGSPCIPCSYRTVIEALKEMKPRTDGELQVVVASLYRHFDKTLKGSEQMTNTIRELVRDLYRDENHRTAIKNILDNVPRFGFLARRIVERVQEYLEEHFQDEPFEIQLYPEQEDRLREMGFYPKRCREKTKSQGFELTYVLRIDRSLSDAVTPDIGDLVRVQLMAWCDSKARRSDVKVLELPKHLPPPEGDTDEWYPRWYSLWASDGYRLRDLWKQDIAGCSKLLIDTIHKTFPGVKEAVEARYGG